MEILEQPKMDSRCRCFTLVRLEPKDIESVRDGSAWYTCPGCGQPVGVKLDAFPPMMAEQILSNVVPPADAGTEHGDGDQDAQ